MDASVLIAVKLGLYKDIVPTWHFQNNGIPLVMRHQDSFVRRRSWNYAAERRDMLQMCNGMLRNCLRLSHQLSETRLEKILNYTVQSTSLGMTVTLPKPGSKEASSNHTRSRTSLECPQKKNFMRLGVYHASWAGGNINKKLFSRSCSL